MNVTIQLFAAAKETAGTSTLKVSLPDDATIVALRDAIAQEQPALANLASHSMFAIADDYVSNDKTLSHGDVVAMIPPVSGG